MKLARLISVSGKRAILIPKNNGKYLTWTKTNKKIEAVSFSMRNVEQQRPPLLHCRVDCIPILAPRSPAISKRFRRTSLQDIAAPAAFGVVGLTLFATNVAPVLPHNFNCPLDFLAASRR